MADCQMQPFSVATGSPLAPTCESSSDRTRGLTCALAAPPPRGGTWLSPQLSKGGAIGLEGFPAAGRRHRQVVALRPAAGLGAIHHAAQPAGKVFRLNRGLQIGIGDVLPHAVAHQQQAIPGGDLPAARLGLRRPVAAERLVRRSWTVKVAQGA